MKKLIVCILCLVSTHLFAQFRLGVQGSFSTLNCWQADQIGGYPTGAQTRQLNGFQAGLFAEYDLGYSGIMLQPALMYAENGTNFGNTLGFTDNGTYSIGYSSTYLRMYSIRLPVNIVYKYAISDKWKVFGGAGPYLAKNLGGTEKGYYQVSYDANNQPGAFPINNTLKISGNPSYAPGGVSNVTAFDLGFDILMGFSYKRFDFSASFNHGFTQVYHTTYTDLGNQFWNFTVGYTLFGHYRKPKL
jgi:Outer membrane protein beta-barrel domain